MKKLLLFVYAVCGYLLSPAQTVNMNVLMGEKNIGQITAQKKVVGKMVNANLSSKVSVSFLIKVNVEQTIVSEYKDGKLMKADMIRTSNISSENKKNGHCLEWQRVHYSKRFHHHHP